MRFTPYELQENVMAQDETGQKVPEWHTVKTVHLCLGYVSDNKLSGDLQARNVTYKALSRDKGFQSGQRIVGCGKVLQLEYAVCRGRYTALFLSEVL